MHAGDRLSAYLDAQLVGADLEAVEAHLRGCEQCVTELEAASGARQALRALPIMEAPPEALVPPRPVMPLRPARRRVLVAAAAAAVLVVGVGFGVNGNRAVPLPLDEVVEQHVARASVDPGFNVLQVQAVANR